MTVLFFNYLAVLQTILGTVCIGGAALVCAMQSLQQYRARAFSAAAGGAMGGLLGAVAGFLGVVLAGLGWAGIRTVQLAGADTEVSELVLWILPAGYVLGTVAGAILGWRWARRRGVVAGSLTTAS